MCHGFSHLFFVVFLHHFVLAQLPTISIRIKVMMDLGYDMEFRLLYIFCHIEVKSLLGNYYWWKKPKYRENQPPYTKFKPTFLQALGPI